MDYFCKSKKIYSWGVFEHYPQNEIFSQIFGIVSFLPLKHPNFMRNFEKTRFPTDILTVVKS